MPSGSRCPALAIGIALLLAGNSGAIARAAARPGSLESAPGMQTATFLLATGTIYVNLPDDLAPGDTASATVNPVPGGKSERDQARQRQELHRYSVDLGGQRAPASEGVRKFSVPAGATTLAIVLLDPRGRPVGDVEAPLRPPAPPPPGYQVPPVGQSGGPVRIAGAFDGDLSDSSVRIGGKVAQPIGESPRQLVVRGPEEAAGPAPIEVSEQGKVVATGTYRNVDVRLSAPMTNLLAGQKTTLTITVTGVEGLEQTLPLRLANRSPEVVRMEGGEEQTLCIRPDEVKVGGKWTKTRGLTGVRAGGLSIHTDLTPPGPQVESSAPAEATLRGELRGRVLLDRPARTATGEALKAGSYEVMVRGAGEHGRVRLLLWRDGKTAGTVDGVVLKRVPATTVCELRDVTDAEQKASAETGDRRFDQLGFTDGGAFVVRDDGGRLHLVLAASEATFSIEADLTLMSH
jgi:hypothetical protein